MVTRARMLMSFEELAVRTNLSARFSESPRFHTR
jgi:hypothetical protein